MTDDCERHGRLARSCSECEHEREIHRLQDEIRQLRARAKAEIADTNSYIRFLHVAESRCDTVRRWSARWKETARRAYNIIGHHADVTRELEAARRWSARWKARLEGVRRHLTAEQAAHSQCVEAYEAQIDELEAARAVVEAAKLYLTSRRVVEKEVDWDMYESLEKSIAAYDAATRERVP
jgi:hypothetical protein